MPRSLFTSEPGRRLISGPIRLRGLFQAFDFFSAFEFFPCERHTPKLGFVIFLINEKTMLGYLFMNDKNQNKTKVDNEKK